MTAKKGIVIYGVIIILALWSSAVRAESEIAKEFSSALEKKDALRLNTIINKNKDKIPAEVQALVDAALAPGIDIKEKEAKLNLAERMARHYKNITADEAPLISEQKRAFESYLSAPVASQSEDGEHTIFIRHHADGTGPFSPDNIVIKKGDTIRWVNENNEDHLLSTASGISSERLVSPKIEPGKSWTHKFYKPGVYYYLCCIHNEKMYGKITVE